MLLSEQRNTTSSTQTTPTNDVGTNTGESLLDNIPWTATPTRDSKAPLTMEKELQEEVLCADENYHQSNKSRILTDIEYASLTKSILQESQNIPFTNTACKKSTPTNSTNSHSNYSRRSLSPPQFSPSAVSSIISQSHLSQSLDVPEYSDITYTQSSMDSDERSLQFEQMKVPTHYVYLTH